MKTLVKDYLTDAALNNRPITLSLRNSLENAFYEVLVLVTIQS